MRVRDRKDFHEALVGVYKDLWREGEIDTLPDGLAGTDDLKRLWANMLQSFPCTDTDVAVTSINLRKSGKLKLETLDSPDESIDIGLFGDHA